MMSASGRNSLGHGVGGGWKMGGWSFFSPFLLRASGCLLWIVTATVTVKVEGATVDAPCCSRSIDSLTGLRSGPVSVSSCLVALAWDGVSGTRCSSLSLLESIGYHGKATFSWLSCLCCSCLGTGKWPDFAWESHYCEVLVSPAPIGFVVRYWYFFGLGQLAGGSVLSAMF